MTPGPTEILKKPETGSLIKVSTIGSGNTFGARFWSDGKMEAPMLPEDLPVVRHPETGETFWREEECVVIATEDPWENDPKCAEVTYGEELREDDIIEELKSDDIDLEQEKYLRIRLWWRWNDPVREGNEELARPSDFVRNLRELIEFLFEDEDNDRLMMAEAWRQLGKHKAAADLLAYQFPEEFGLAVDTIRSANEKCETLVVEVVDGTPQ